MNVMKVRSSDTPRTIMSAQSLLLGLYPLGSGPNMQGLNPALPKGFQPVPISTVPREQDSLLIPNYDKKMYLELLKTYIFNDPDWIKKELELKPNYGKWSQISGIPINKLLDIIHVGDRLYIDSLYKLPLLEGLTENEAEIIINAGNWAMLKIANQPQIAAETGNSLAQMIKHEISLAASQERPLKYLLFVAQDTTIAAQLKLLDQSIEDMLPYASRLNYSLYDMGGANYEMRVTYNQKRLQIKGCGGYSCTLSNFFNSVNYIN